MRYDRDVARDERVSREAEIDGNIPPPTLIAKDLEENFARKGLSLDEMGTLSGAHSVGVSHCPPFSFRLYNFNSTHPQDPSLDPVFAKVLKTVSPTQNSGNEGDKQTVIPLDFLTPNRLDNKYYTGLKNHHGLLTSDQTLLSSSSTAQKVRNNARNGAAWANKFAAAMVKMGRINVLTGSQGEVRKYCNIVN